MVAFHWSAAIAHDSMPPKLGVYQIVPLTDTADVKRAEFKREWKAKLAQLQLAIEEKKVQVQKGKKESREKLLKELDQLEDSRKELELELEDAPSKNQQEWDKFKVELQANYDETESRVRNFFKKK